MNLEQRRIRQEACLQAYPAPEGLSWGELYEDVSRFNRTFLGDENWNAGRGNLVALSADGFQDASKATRWLDWASGRTFTEEGDDAEEQEVFPAAGRTYNGTRTTSGRATVPRPRDFQYYYDKFRWWRERLDCGDKATHDGDKYPHGCCTYGHIAIQFIWAILERSRNRLEAVLHQFLFENWNALYHTPWPVVHLAFKAMVATSMLGSFDVHWQEPSGSVATMLGAASTTPSSTSSSDILDSDLHSESGVLLSDEWKHKTLRFSPVATTAHAEGRCAVGRGRDAAADHVSTTSDTAVRLLELFSEHTAAPSREARYFADGLAPIDHAVDSPRRSLALLRRQAVFTKERRTDETVADEGTDYRTTDMRYGYGAFSPLRVFNQWRSETNSEERDAVCERWEQSSMEEDMVTTGNEQQLVEGGGRGKMNKNTSYSRVSQEQEHFRFPYYDVHGFQKRLDRDFCAESEYIHGYLKLGMDATASKVTPTYAIRWLQRWFWYPMMTRIDGYVSLTDNGEFLRAGDAEGGSSSSPDGVLKNARKMKPSAAAAGRGSSSWQTHDEKDFVSRSLPALLQEHAPPSPSEEEEGFQLLISEENGTTDGDPCSLYKLTTRVLYNAGATRKSRWCDTLAGWVASWRTRNPREAVDVHDLTELQLVRLALKYVADPSKQRVARTDRGMGYRSAPHVLGGDRTRSVVYLYSLRFWDRFRRLVEKEFLEVRGDLDVDFHMKQQWRAFDTSGFAYAKGAARERDDGGARKKAGGEAGKESQKQNGDSVGERTTAAVQTTEEVAQASSTLNEQLSRDERHALLQLLKAVHELCEAFHFPYLLSSGTLLGALRHHSLIPWTGDAEVSLDYSYFPFVFNVALLQSVFSSTAATFLKESTSASSRMISTQLASWLASNGAGVKIAERIFGVRKMALQMYARRPLSLKFFYDAAHEFSEPVPGFSYRFPYLDIHPNYVDEAAQDLGYTSYVFGYKFPLAWAYPRRLSYIEGSPFYVWHKSDSVLQALYKGKVSALKECRGHHLNHRGFSMGLERMEKNYNCSLLLNVPFVEQRETQPWVAEEELLRLVVGPVVKQENIMLKSILTAPDDEGRTRLKRTDGADAEMDRSEGQGEHGHE
eukprot:g4760.t1